ncbi:MAG: transcriptional repressor [Candidatus Aminicenantes bacterium]|nr:transcriptional repressor [Candidatus Aminicenantes bacterium]
MKYRKSRQRNKILEILENTKTHPTADWIYDKLKKDFPKLSVGNVYRNLNILVEQGLIRRIDFGSTFDRFDAVRTPHYHFICEQCGAVIDLDLSYDDQLNQKAMETSGFSVYNHKIQFYGLCDKCKNKQRSHQHQ